jgi:DnaJ-class molecular chaperone
MIMIIFALVIGRLAASVSDYETLGIPFGSDMDAVKSAYRKEALEWHPDKNSDPRASDRFIKISNAYEAIKNGNNQGKAQDPFKVFKDFMGNGFSFSFTSSTGGVKMSGTSSSTSTIIQNGKRVTKTVKTDLASGKSESMIVEEDLRTGEIRKSIMSE